MTEPGQTDNYSVSDHLNAIIEHCGNGVVDYCIYDTGEIVPEFIKKYNLEGQDLVEQDIEKVKGIKFLQRNLSMISGKHIRHDPSLVASSIIELICDDLKYQDKQNDPQYLMLNTKLREEKRINKIKKSMEKKAKKGKTENKKKWKSKSKFSNKYSDRIASIREADEKARKRSQKENEKKSKRVKKEKRSMTQKTTRNTAKVAGRRNLNEERTSRIETKNIERREPIQRKKTPQQIREEMLRKLQESNLKDK